MAGQDIGLVLPFFINDEDTMSREDILAKLQANDKKVKKTGRVKAADFLSSGCTLLNLAVTDHPFCCYKKGSYYYFVGDSESGKTWFTLMALAEAAHHPDFKDYALVHDDVENGALMDKQDYFGTETNSRIISPAKEKDGTPIYSKDVEDFYYYLDDYYKEGTPFVWVEDSMDSLTSSEEEKKFEENKKARRKVKSKDGEESGGKGSYGVSKAKKNSENLRQVMPKLRDTNSILIIISQTRDNIGGGLFGPKKTRSGGNALKFYATIEIWTSVIGKIKKTVKGKPREIGSKIQLVIKKNRVKGLKRKVTVDFYPSFGVDDIGSNIAYLLEEKHWTKKKGSIVAPEFDYEGTTEKLIKKIEEEEGETKLAKLVANVWKEIADNCKVERKKKYK